MGSEIQCANDELQWKKMAQNCVSQYTCPVLIEKGKCILFIGLFIDSCGIIIYDVQSDTYPESLKSPRTKNTKLFAHALTFNAKKNLVYVWGGKYHSCFMILDLSAKKWITKIAQNATPLIEQKYNVKHVGRDSRIIVDSNEILHVIGGSKCNTHMIFNGSQQIFEERYAFDEFQGMDGFGLVCDSMVDRLILFGGMGYGEHKNKWLNDIWFYGLSTNSWTKCRNFRMLYPLSDFGFVFLKCIQIILIFGGQSIGHVSTDVILLLDLSNYSCIEISHIHCPMKVTFHALLVPHRNSLGNHSLSNVHLFERYSKKHWCMSVESILPSNYFQLYRNSKTISELNRNIPDQMQLEMKEQQERIYAAVENEKALNQSMRNMMENKNLELKQEINSQNAQIVDIKTEMKEMMRNNNQALNDYKQQMKEMRELIQKKDAIIEQKKILDMTEESKYEDIEGNYNLKYMNNKEVLSMREKSFKTYFYSVVPKMADEYYQLFVKNSYNDLEFLIEFAYMEDKNESLGILCKVCGMNEMHARQLLRRISELSLSNSEFKEWFKTHQMLKYYDMMLGAGVATFTMFEDKLIFVCCTDFVQFLGKGNEKEGISIWNSLVLKKNVNENKKVQNRKTTAFHTKEISVGDEGYEGDEAIALAI